MSLLESTKYALAEAGLRLPVRAGHDGEILGEDGECFVVVDPNRELADDKVATIAAAIVTGLNAHAAHATDAASAGSVGEMRPDDEALDPHLPESIRAEKRCGIQRSDWLTGWFVPWSPRNENQNAEGPWSHWVSLANVILAADAKAIAALHADTRDLGGEA